MTTEETEKRNEAIALFMGVDFTPYSGVSKILVIENLTYNSEWNELMPVVEKIVEEGYNIGMGINYWKGKGSFCHIENFDGQNMKTIISKESSTHNLINDVFLAVSDYCLTLKKP